ncbi:MAG: hypothetical protein K9J13_03290 [Saprospiraceae bacterium]|nr:hypothetical protein [Saprospiraceae bacterium]
MNKTVSEINEKGRFRLIDHSITHNQVLYRAYKDSEKNVDILLSGVQYFELPIYLNDCKISVGKENDVEYIRTKFNYEEIGKVFVIEQDNYRHYIVADNILVQENEFATLETSIPIKREKPLDEKENLEFYEKMELVVKEKGSQYLKDLMQDTGDWKILK